MSLSAEQRAAVERIGQDVCVVAGPGSGKTRVLVERFAWLVEEQGADPGRILAITFTEKAARMMKRRLVQRFVSRPELREAVERAWVMTIDAFCARLLRENAIEAGLAPDFGVLDEAAANRLRREAAETALDALFEEQPEQMRRLMEALALATSDDERQVDLAQSLIEIHETMRRSGVRELPALTPVRTDTLPEAQRLAAELQHDPRWSMWHDWARRFRELPEAPITREHFELAGEYDPNFRGKKKAQHPVASGLEEILGNLQAQWIVAWNEGLPELLRTAVARLDQQYRAAKRQQAAVDFADLAELTIELLGSDPALRRRSVEQFDYILMDELQDTDRLQWKLVAQFRRPAGFFAVGDINQSIYGFRHADRAVFDEFRAELRSRDHAVDELRENYRSRTEILETVARVLHESKGVEARELVAMRESLGGDPIIEKLYAENGIQQEAELVADRIAAWKQMEGRGWGDFAILVRALAHAEPFERALEQRGIPFVVSGGRTFMETREARDVLALLAALVNPLDGIATAGLLRGPLAGWTDDELLQGGADGRAAAVEAMFGKARGLAGFVPADRMLAQILDERGYLGHLGERGRANLDKLLGWIRREGRARPQPLAELLEDLEALRDAQAEAEAPPQQASDAVNIMTIHAAKGLEYKVVFVAALHRSANNRSPVLLFDRESGLGAKWRHPVTGAALKDAVHEKLSEDLKKREAQEDERLFYVAMTRAEDRLVLSYAKTGRASALVRLVEKAFLPPGEPLAPVDFHADGIGAAPAPDIILEAPAVGAQHDSSVPVTSVALFAACPRKYFWARYIGLDVGLGPQPGQPGTGAIDLGLEVHGALAGQPAQSREALELVGRFQASALGQRMARAQRVEREFDFLLAVDDIVLRGQIDAWFEERPEDGGELVLLDYKTDRDESGFEEYALQLRLYALALERYTGRLPTKAALCFLRSGEVREVGLGKEDLEGARDTLLRLARAQDRLEFPLKVGEQCRRCRYYGGVCPANLEEAGEAG